jgi:hypothetical protein
LVAGGVAVIPVAVPGVASVAHAQSALTCSSSGGQYSYCAADTSRGVRLESQFSRSPCIQGRSWGTDPRGIWVDRGCSGLFAVGGRGQGGGGHGAAVIGGMVGAMLGASISAGTSHSYTTTTRSFSYHSSGWGPTPQPWTRDGGPNFDRLGRYSGPHGLGALVDNPDRDPPASQEADPTVQKFDRNGNPNYDSDGNYIGAHGLGALVDNPDNPG